MELLEEQIKDLQTANHFRRIETNVIDIRVQGLIDNLKIKGKKILDIGSLDGYHACNMASQGAIVTCSDIRPQNLHSALYRCLYYGYNDVTFRLLDMETMHEEIKKDEYDIIFHSGCFYHLSNPVEHLFNIKDLSEYILLETHISNPEKYKSYKMDYGNETYEGTIYPDGDWGNTAGSKCDEFSFWLSKESLLKLFSECKLSIVKTIYDDVENPHGIRVCYLLKRNKLSMNKKETIKND